LITCAGCGKDREHCLPCPDCGRMNGRECRLPDLRCKDQDSCLEAQRYNQQRSVARQLAVQPARCPDCGGPLGHGEGGVTCPVCGFTNAPWKSVRRGRRRRRLPTR